MKSRDADFRTLVWLGRVHDGVEGARDWGRRTSARGMARLLSAVRMIWSGAVDQPAGVMVQPRNFHGSSVEQAITQMFGMPKVR